jgi:nucleoside-diphosphate-sugar epimerase
MKKAIVTGANGFIGSHLVNKLINNNVEVISIVHNRDSNLTLLPNNENNKLIFCDLSEIENLTSLITDRDFDVFYHFAWQGSTGQTRADEKLQTQNALWTVDSVRIAKELGCKKFIGAGSIMEKEAMAAVYTDGNEPGLGYIYGTGKLMAHCMSKSVAANIGIDHIWAIITNAYGPGELSARFLNTTIRKIINDEPLKFTAATQNYDFIYITDAANAFYNIGHHGKPFYSYTIGSSNAKPLKDYLIELQKEIAPEVSLHFGDVPFTGINMSLDDFCTENLEKDTGFKPIVSFKEGVRYTMDWLIEMEKHNDTKIFI